jgi:hypothetical protein
MGKRNTHPRKGLHKDQIVLFLTGRHEGEAGGVEEAVTNTIKEKLDEILKNLPPDKQGELYNELHAFMCKSIIELLQDSIAGPGISQQQIKTARDAF